MPLPNFLCAPEITHSKSGPKVEGNDGGSETKRNVCVRKFAKLPLRGINHFIPPVLKKQW